MRSHPHLGVRDTARRFRLPLLLSMLALISSPVVAEPSLAIRMGAAAGFALGGAEFCRVSQMRIEATKTIVIGQMRQAASDAQDLSAAEDGMRAAAERRADRITSSRANLCFDARKRFGALERACVTETLARCALASDAP